MRYVACVSLTHVTRRLPEMYVQYDTYECEVLRVSHSHMGHDVFSTRRIHEMYVQHGTYE